MKIATRKNLCIIYNPTAGRRRARFYDAVVAALENLECRATVRRTTGPDSAAELARAAAAEPFDAIIVAGGDGTINGAVNGIAGSPMPLGLIPLGTANVLAAEIGLPRRPEAVAATLARGPLQDAYVGRANGRAFTLMAEAGFNAKVVHEIDLGLKRWIGKAAYGWSAVRVFVRGGGAMYDVDIDGRPYKAAAVVIAKGRYYGGRFVFAPDARLGEASFEVCLVERPGRWNTLRYGAGLLGGFLPRLAGYRIETGRRVTVAGPAGDPVQCDGDDATTLPLTVTLDPTPLSLIVPES